MNDPMAFAMGSLLYIKESMFFFSENAEAFPDFFKC